MRERRVHGNTMTHTPYYMHGMADAVRSYSLAGLASDADVASLLQRRYHPDITDGHVKLWRAQHKLFNAAVAHALADMDAEAVSVISEAIRDQRDVATAKWWLERRNAHFKPSSKIEHGGRIEGLDARLAARLDEDALREQGVLYDDEPDAGG